MARVECSEKNYCPVFKARKCDGSYGPCPDEDIVAEVALKQELKKPAPPATQPKK